MPIAKLYHEYRSRFQNGKIGKFLTAAIISRFFAILMIFNERSASRRRAARCWLSMKPNMQLFWLKISLILLFIGEFNEKKKKEFCISLQ